MRVDSKTSRIASSVSGASLESVRKNLPPSAEICVGAFRFSAQNATSEMWHQKSMKLPPE